MLKEFIKAIEENDISQLRALLQGINHSSSQLEDYHLLLHKALSKHPVSNSSLEILELLIKNGAYINKQDSNGNTPLHLAIELNNYEIVKLLIDNEADVLIPNFQGMLPIALPNVLKNQEICKMLEEVRKFQEFVKYVSDGGMNDIISKNQNVVLVLGNSKVGKSTLINYLANPEKVTGLRKGLGSLKIDVPNPITDKMRVNHSNTSETTTPDKWIDPETELVYWDSPGFSDNRGATQDIKNAIFIKKLFETPEKLKLVLLVEQNSLTTEGGKLFVELVGMLGDLFKDRSLETIKAGLSLIITKVEQIDITVKSVQEELEGILSSANVGTHKLELNDYQKQIIGYLKEGSIALFRAPQLNEGTIQIQNDKPNILKAVNDSDFISSSIVNIVIKPDSKLFLKRLVNNLNKNIVNKVKEFLDSIIANCRTEIGEAMDLATLKSYLNKNADKLKVICDAKGLKDFIRGIEDFNNEFNQKYPTHISKIKGVSELLELCEQIDDETQYKIEQWQNPINKLIFHLEKLVTSTDIKYEDGVLKAKGILVSTSEITKKQEELSKEIKHIKIYSLNSTFIDSNIQLKGKNVSILSPKYKIDSNRTIDLSGIDGEAPKEPKALDSNLNGHAGADGNPGLSGNFGGNFIGMCVKSKGLEKLTINLNGGKGGKGQSGGDGCDGADGINGDKEKVENRDESVLLSRKALGISDKQGRDKAIHIIKKFGTYNGQFIEEFESKGKVGQKGGDGGKGGEGGEGGHPGNILISVPNTDHKTLNVIKNFGDIGEVGDAGRGGKGGKAGVTYYGKYFNEVVAPWARNYKDSEATSVLPSVGFAVVTGLVGEVGEEVAEQAVLEGAKQVTSAVLKESAKTAVTEGTATALKSGIDVASFGTSIAIQTTLSGFSAFASSSWIEKPKEIYGKPSLNGISPKEKNENNREKAKESPYEVQSDINTLKNEFILLSSTEENVFIDREGCDYIINSLEVLGNLQ